MHAGLVAALRKNDPASIKLNHRLVDFEQDDSSVIASFDNGKSATGLILIGADGIRSCMRAKLFDEVPPKFTGQVAYSATLSAKGLEPYLKVADSSVTVGPGQIVVWYPIRGGALVDVVAIAESDAWKEEGWNTPATKDEVLAEHDGWNSDVLGLISCAPENSFYRWALFDREPLAEWTQGRVTMAGDAAHPMLPFLGMGAAMAFEDAFEMYKKARHQRTPQVLLDSRIHGTVLQGSDPDKVDWKNLKSGNDWSYFSYNPVTTSLS